MSDYSIPTLTKEDIFTKKDINYITEERKFTGTDFDDKITQYNIDAVGYAKAIIMPKFYSQIENSTWRNLIILYIRWQIDSSLYTTVGQDLVNNFYIQLRDMLQSINANMTLIAEEKVVTTKRGITKINNYEKNSSGRYVKI